MGKLLWIELRDRYGRTQLLCEQGHTPIEVWTVAKSLGREDVVQVEGQVVARQSINHKLPTGEIELRVQVLTRFSAAELPPFTLNEETDGGELLRLQYRYLDLRRATLQRNLQLRHQLYRAIRDFLDKAHFIEIDTPLLIKPTPEGARDFIVPARLHPGCGYALPQSPQIFKQLLMVAGMDRYYQLAHCFRDEDHRADRQPEFMQLDCELSFVTQDDILQLFEAVVCHVFHSVKGYKLPQPFDRIPYEAAVQRYGTDKPDLRYDMPLFVLEKSMDWTDFPLFSQNEMVGGIVLSQGAARSSRRQLDAWRNMVCQPQVGAAGLAYLRVGTLQAHSSPLSKHFSQEILQGWVEKVAAVEGDLILFVAGKHARVAAASSLLRSELAAAYQLYDTSQYKPLWVIDFPLFKQHEGSNSLHAVHHPFTAPCAADEGLLATKPLEARAQAYDLVINGVEIGGGSVRITSSTLQAQVFSLLGLPKAEIDAQFGFLLQAFRYGVPPHGGIALGLDRLCALLIGEGHSIRDCIAFPKNTAGRDLMLGAPAHVT